MSITNVVVYDFSLQGVTSARDLLVYKNKSVIIILTFALCDESGNIISPGKPPSSCFTLSDYYSGSASYNGFTASNVTVEQTKYGSYTVQWTVTPNDTYVRQTFGYIIDTGSWGGALSAQAYNLSMKGAQNSLSLYTLSS